MSTSKHAEQQAAFARGARIQIWCRDHQEWETVGDRGPRGLPGETPSWDEDNTYRVHPDEADHDAIGPLLFEHEDGRYMVCTGPVSGDPGWHRLGPVVVVGDAAMPVVMLWRETLPNGTYDHAAVNAPLVRQSDAQAALRAKDARIAELEAQTWFLSDETTIDQDDAWLDAAEAYESAAGMLRGHLEWRDRVRAAVRVLISAGRSARTEPKT